MLSITMNGKSTIDGKAAANMSASINSQSGTSSLSTYISDKELYSADKATVQEDIKAFQDAVYAILDEEAGAAETGTAE